MAHADDIGKYEGPPCEICRVSQFVGTCTHRPRKYPEYTFPDFTTAEFEQMKAQKESIIAKEQDRVATAWMEQIADLQASLKTVCAERDSLVLQIDEMKKAIRALVADRAWRANHPNPEIRLGLHADTLVHLESFLIEKPVGLARICTCTGHGHTDECELANKRKCDHRHYIEVCKDCGEVI